VNPKGVADGQPVNIPAPPFGIRWGDEGYKEKRGSGYSFLSGLDWRWSKSPSLL
jgi:hypothetical protein